MNFADAKVGQLFLTSLSPYVSRQEERCHLLLSVDDPRIFLDLGKGTAWKCSEADLDRMMACEVLYVPWVWDPRFDGGGER